MEHAQRAAASAVRRVLGGTTLPVALAGASTASTEERALIQELAYGTLRFLGQIRALVRLLADRPLADASLEALLWIALYQLTHTSAPKHAVVDAAVNATGRLKKSSARGLTNAILRNFLRRRDELLALAERDDAARFSYQAWWIERVRAQYGTRATAILDAGNARPPLTLRVNRRAIARDDFVAALAAKGIAGTAIGAAGVILATPSAVGALPGYDEGWFSVQDAGAQLAAPLLGVADGMRVLDACAAPGGKTTHLAELAELDLLALDSDPQRIERVAQNLARLNLQARVEIADAAELSAWWGGKAFDRILLDVPCTASGVVRRHPDGKWLRRESDVHAFGAQQQRLLDALWPGLAPGGRLLYTTCSIFAAENATQVAAFVARQPNASPVPLQFPAGFDADQGQLLPAPASAEHNHDGFFYALLQKN
ncbi:MAG: 16S rRNA (cytosine(967)-C(5))-methyltransferase RsmB [Casimicrobiaceae bacterium]